MAYQLALELGGTNFTASIFDHAANTPGSLSRRPGQICAMGKIQDFQNFDELMNGVATIAHEISPDLAGKFSKLERIIVAAPTLNPEGVIPNTIDMTNGYPGFLLSRQNNFQWHSTPVEVHNDFAMTAYAPAGLLTGIDWLNLPNDRKPNHLQNRVCYVIGPGTGLGTATSIIQAYPNTVEVRPSELQHNYMPPSDAYPSGLVEHIYGQILNEQGREGNANLPKLTFEEMVSGRGLCRIYKALQKIKNLQEDNIDTASIVENASGGDPIAVESLRIFFFTLGRASAALVKSGYHNQDNAVPILIIAGGMVPKILAACPSHKDGFVAELKNGISENITTNEAGISNTFQSYVGRMSIGFYPRGAGIMGIENYAAIKYPARQNTLPIDRNHLSGP